MAGLTVQLIHSPYSTQEQYCVLIVFYFLRGQVILEERNL